MQRSKDLIHQYYDHFNKKNLEAFLELLADDVIHEINQGSVEIGKVAFTRFMQRMSRSYKETVKNLTVMVSEDGTRAAAEFVIEGEYFATDEGLPAATGQKYQLACGAFFEIKKGKIVRMTNYYNLKDWLSQVA